MAIPVKSIREWEERVAQLTRGETAKTLLLYETTLVSLCGSHRALIDALSGCATLSDEAAALLAGWANRHAALVEDVSNTLSHIAAAPTDAVH